MQHYTKAAILTIVFIIFSIHLKAQSRKDNAVFGPAIKNNFYENIVIQTNQYAKKAIPEVKRLTMSFEGIEIPKANDEFKIVTADNPVSQGITGTCWCFSTTSFYESEVKRIANKDVQLSEIFTVYWQYIEKVKEYVRTRGKSLVDEGSETNAVQEMFKLYGAVPLEIYNGLLPGQPYHNHEVMMQEMRTYLQSVKERSAWNENEILNTVKNIMNTYMGVPPTEVLVDGKKITPQEYFKSLQLNSNDYLTFMSLKSETWGTNAEYKVPDNWWHSTNYTNLPMVNFVQIFTTALDKGYSISFGGDVSESGINSKLGVMMIPSYDIPSEYINDDARLVRFINGSTTDDHAMHVIGYTTNKSGKWFLVKDSGAGGHNNDNHKGYWYMHEDFVKLKMMTFTVHKNAVDAKQLNFATLK